jgi:putative sterol carrier protein
MATAAEKFIAAHTRLRAREQEAAQIGATYKFVLDGEDGGTWLVNLKDQIGVTEGSGAADCVIKMRAGDFVDLLDGRTSAQQLFFSGKLRVEGDMGLAVRLQKLTELLA